MDWREYWAEVAAAAAVIVLMALVATCGVGCTVVSYDAAAGQAWAGSLLQKRTLVVELDGEGGVRGLRYTSGSEPIVIPAYGSVGGGE